MAIRKPIKLSWEGVEYKIIVNMLLIGRIDDEVGIIKIMRTTTANPKIFLTAQLIHILLDECGVVIDYKNDDDEDDTRPISLEDVYDGLGSDISNKDLQSVMKEITPMLLPQFNGVAKKKDSPKRRRKPRKK